MFHHLHGHSHFSNLLMPDALNSPTALVKRAKAAGLTSLCLTDHASVSGIPEFVKACKAEGLKCHPGTELYVCDDPAWRPEPGAERKRDYVHVVALAKNFDGFVELLGLLSKAHGEPNFYYKPRNSFLDLTETKNVIFLTACAGGIFKHEQWLARCRGMLTALGPDRFYAEIQPHWDAGQIQANARAIEAHYTLGMKLVATQDFHYAAPDDAVTHEVLLAIGTKDTWSNPKRFRYPVSDLYVKSLEEMVTAFKPHVDAGHLTADQVLDAIGRTGEIAAAIDFQWRKIPVSLPDMGSDPDLQVLQMAATELKRRGLHTDPRYVNRLVYEMDVLKKSGFISYFLVLADIINWSKKQGIYVAPGRGSSGGSLVCWLIGITRIDPIKHDLLFERFYRPGRIDLPDIDSDFEDERRDEALNYAVKRWGAEHTGHVCTLTTLGAKGAIKDVARVFELDHKLINDVTSKIDDKAGDDETLNDAGVVALFAKHPHLEYHVRKLLGCVRTTGKHAGGLVIAGNPLSKHAVVTPDDGIGRNVVNWDKYVIEDMGLMKLDLLGLRTLAILRIINENLKKTRGMHVDLDAIPLDDAKTLDLFQHGATTGIFQFESRGMRALLKSLRVDKFDVIVDANSLYRPGPMDLIPQYEVVQNGRSPPYYAHPLLEPILSGTYGVLIYQEQLMRVFVDVGGFTYAEADGMRKIVSKSMGADEFKKHEEKFVAGAVVKGVEEITARKIFGDMIKFGGYGFNRSHAVAYSMIAFWSAYFKVHYPAEYYAAYLSNSSDDQMATAIDDAIKSGIEIDMPDINLSESRRFAVITDRKIQAPLAAVKGVGLKAAELIVGARQGRLDHQGLGAFDTREEKAGTVGHDATYVRSGPFNDEKDFLARVYKRIVNSKVQRVLGEIGAMPWVRPDDEALIAKRRELIGHIYREIIVVDPGAELVWDDGCKTQMLHVWNEANDLAKDAGGVGCQPSFGSRPRVMLIFEKPEYKDERSGQLGHGDGFDVARKLLKERLGMTMKDLFVTSYHRFRNCPLGLDKYEEKARLLLAAEIQLTKPPLIIAFGKKPMEFFAGAGIRVGEMHGKVVRYGATPVLLSISPIQVVMEPGKREKFETIADTLKELYV